MINVLSYGIKIWTDLSSVLPGITRLTDGQTDRRTDRILAIPRLHYMQRGKNRVSVQQCRGVYPPEAMVRSPQDDLMGPPSFRL